MCARRRLRRWSLRRFVVDLRHRIAEAFFDAGSSVSALSRDGWTS
jgi:hypothetical protein